MENKLTYEELDEMYNQAILRLLDLEIEVQELKEKLEVEEGINYLLRKG